MDYGPIVLVEEWTGDQWEAHGRFSRLISGQEKIGGHEIKHVFPQSTASRNFYSGVGGCPTWSVTSHIVKDSEWKEFYSPQVPLLGYDLKPYLTPAHAVNEWVFGIDYSMQPGASFQNQWSLVTVVPDLRVRVISAEWLPGTLHLELALRVPADQVQLQIIHAGAVKSHRLLEVKAGEQRIEIPDDAQKPTIFVVDQTGGRLADLMTVAYELRSVFKENARNNELLSVRRRCRVGPICPVLMCQPRVAASS